MNKARFDYGQVKNLIFFKVAVSAKTYIKMLCIISIGVYLV